MISPSGRRLAYWQKIRLFAIYNSLTSYSNSNFFGWAVDTIQVFNFVPSQALRQDVHAMSDLYLRRDIEHIHYLLDTRRETMESSMHVVVRRFMEEGESIRETLEKMGGWEGIGRDSHIFLKPNIVVWARNGNFPKWGVITTSRVVHDVAAWLKEWGFEHIHIGEGVAMVPAHGKHSMIKEAYSILGYERLKEKFGIVLHDVLDGPFESVECSDGVKLNVFRPAVESDLIISLPVLKTHAQTRVSLGIKNLKGLIDIPSRKRCHSPDPSYPLERMIASIPQAFRKVWSVIDGIYSLERGPSFDGKARRFNVIVGSRDLLLGDVVGARLLGYEHGSVPHLTHAASTMGRSLDFSNVTVDGPDIETIADLHPYDFAYTSDNCLPIPLARMGVQGLCYRKYDDTLCTYCSELNGMILSAVARAWNGKPWPKVEVLTGKKMAPSPGMEATILLGKCMSETHKNNPIIRRPINVKTCPPHPKAVAKAFREVGIEIDEALLDDLGIYAMAFFKRYSGKPDFDESFYRIS